MSKLRSDSTWAVLTPPQKETITEWLFEENLGYDEALERIRKEFGISASKSSLASYYQSLANERLCEDLSEAHALANQACGANANVSTWRGAAVRIIGKKLMDCALKPGPAKELPTLATLILQSEQHEIQREWLALARERFEFKASKAALKVLPLLDEMNRDDEAREIARIETIKRKIFGNLVDGME